MFLDANAELDEIDPAVRHLPEVLGVRLGIYRGLGKWELMEAVAKKLTHYDPDNAQWWISWAFATRRADSIEAARRILLQAVEQRFDVAVMPSVVWRIACSYRLIAEKVLARMLEGGVTYGHESITSYSCSSSLVRWRRFLPWRACYRRRRIWSDSVGMYRHLFCGRIPHESLTLQQR